MGKYLESLYKKILMTIYSILMVVSLATVFSHINVYATEELEVIDMGDLQATYTALYAPDYVPYSYMDDAGEAQGMVIAMMEYIADIADVEIIYVSNESDYDVEDIDMNLSILEKDALEDISIQSVSYFSFPLVLTGEGKWDASAGSVVGCLDYITLSRDEIFKAISQNGLRTYYNYSELVAAYNSGEVDYIVVSSIVGSLLDLQKTDETESISLSISLESVIMFHNTMSIEEIDIFNEIIGSIDTTKIYQLLVETAMEVSMENENSFSEFIIIHKVEIVSTVVIIMLVWLLSVYYLKQKALLDFVNTDKLTGLLSERRFMEETDVLIKKTGNLNKFQIISMDVDNFKYINESFGMIVGTEVIERIALCIQEEFGTYSILFARVVADKFLILTKQDNYILDEQLKRCTKKLEENIREILGKEFRLHISVGIYQINDISLPVSYMADCANIARGQGKNIYNHTYIFFTKEIEEKMRIENNVAGSMEHALENKEFKMVYQPKINLKTSEIVGAEALVRWMKPDGKQIFPDEFIPVLERNGFIVSLDYYVLDSVCAFIKDKPYLKRVSVNFSGFTMIKSKFADMIIEIVEIYNVDPNRLEIEITESAFVENFDLMIHDIKKLQEYGIVISMDDFGTGVSSLGRLKDMDIDVLKIDKNFVSDTLRGVRGHTIIHAIISMAKALGIETVAEGVETEEQVEMLKNLECDIVQGYFYARPMEPEQFIAFVNTFKEKEK